MKTIFLFPGQGSQSVGMGVSLAENFPLAKDTFQEANEALGFDLWKICREGPEADLKLTQNTQPAILMVSVAAARVIAAETPLRPDLVAGHSLGEYSALVSAGALDFKEAVQLVNKRGKFMQEAVPAGRGAMAALIGGTEAGVKSLCDEAKKRTQKVCEMANFNGGGQIVISGEAEAVEEAARLVGAEPGFGIAKAVLLPVSAPFHCSLMRKAEENLLPFLERAKLGTLKVPYIANVDAKLYSDSAKVKENLRAQICASVRWEQSMLTLAGMGVTAAYEIGPGKVLSGLLRRIDRNLKCKGVESAEDVRALAGA